MSPFRVEWPEARSPESEVLVGVVHSGGAVCHVSVATSARRLARELAKYVRECARYQLGPGDSTRVEELLDEGRAQEAVDHYFGVAQQRWGRERLVVRRVGFAAERWPETVEPR